MSTYDRQGREVFWGWDQHTDLGYRIPGPGAVLHVFRSPVNRRRALTLCGQEMLTYSFPSQFEDIRFDSHRIPVCPACAEASDTARILKLLGASFARGPSPS